MVSFFKFNLIHVFMFPKENTILCESVTNNPLFYSCFAIILFLLSMFKVNIMSFSFYTLIFIVLIVLYTFFSGTGKTLVARALANECSQGDKKVAFFMRKGADCLSKWVGESERQLRLLFDQVICC